MSWRMASKRERMAVSWPSMRCSKSANLRASSVWLESPPSSFSSVQGGFSARIWVADNVRYK